MEIRSKYRCPSCDRDVLNRRVRHCLFCNAALPASFLITGEQIVEMDDKKRQEIARHYRDHPEEQPTAASDIDERIKDAWDNVMEILKYLK